MTLLPRALHDDLITQQHGPDLLIYHKRRHRAIHLESIAAEVFRLCDGVTPISQGSEFLCARLQADPEEASRLLDQTLARLERAGLVEKGPSRRQLLKGVGRLVAGLAVASVVAPPPAYAQSCVIGNAGCATQGVNCAPCRQNAASACNRYCCPPNHYTRTGTTLITGWRCRAAVNNCRNQPAPSTAANNICP